MVSPSRYSRFRDGRVGCGGARAAGPDDESIESLLRVTLRAAAEEEIA
jgi:hypothetical protein